MLTFILCMISGAIAISLIFYFASWTTHLSMTRGSTVQYGKGTYNDFVREFNRHNFDDYYFNQRFHGSLFSTDGKSKIHASIIMFDGKGMTIGFLDYWRVVLYYKKHLPAKEMVKW